MCGSRSAIPPQIYSDGGAEAPPSAIDYTKTVSVRAGATLTLSADPADGVESDNYSGSGGTGAHIVVPGIRLLPTTSTASSSRWTWCAERQLVLARTASTRPHGLLPSAVGPVPLVGG